MQHCWRAMASISQPLVSPCCPHLRLPKQVGGNDGCPCLQGNLHKALPLQEVHSLTVPAVAQTEQERAVYLQRACLSRVWYLTARAGRMCRLQQQSDAHCLHATCQHR